jgi:hypothetical protein
LPFGRRGGESSSEESVKVFVLTESRSGCEAADRTIVEGGFGEAALEGEEIGLEIREVAGDEGVFWGAGGTCAESQGEGSQSKG